MFVFHAIANSASLNNGAPFGFDTNDGLQKWEVTRAVL